MHRTLKEMPGPSAEMTAIASHWDAATHVLRLLNCGHVPPVIIRADGSSEVPDLSVTRGLGGRSAPQPTEHAATLSPGDRLLLISDGVILHGEGKAGLENVGVIDAARRSRSGSAADTVRKIHTAVLEASGGDLSDDATAVCLAVS
jgi:serine phosphatase RsbU (regulator of sigma subunit)